MNLYPIKVKVLLTSLVWTEYLTQAGQVVRIPTPRGQKPGWRRTGDTGTLIRQGSLLVFRPDRKSRRRMFARKSSSLHQQRTLAMYNARARRWAAAIPSGAC